MIVVLAAMLGSLTRAARAAAQARRQRRQGPDAVRRRAPRARRSFWGGVVDARPAPAGRRRRASAALLVALALPALTHAHEAAELHRPAAGPPDRADLQRIQAAFPGSQTPAVLVVKATNVMTPQYRGAYDAVPAARARDRGALRAVPRLVNRDRTVARVEFSIAGKGDDDASIHALKTLREDVIPPIAAKLPGRRGR